MLLRSGQPYNLTVPGDIANTGNASGYMRPNFNGGEVTIDNPSPAKWFNTAAFSVPAQLHFWKLRPPCTKDVTAGRILISLSSASSQSRKANVWSSGLRCLMPSTTWFTAAPNNNITSGDFGRVFGVAKQPRQIQMALKFLF